MTATPKPHRLRNGDTVWRVAFRPVPGGSPTTETFDDFDAALRFAQLVDRVGGAAARQLRDATSVAPLTDATVATAIADHLARLDSSAQEGTIAEYERIANARIIPHLGDTPASLLTRRDVELWIAKIRRTPITSGRHAGRPPSDKTIREAHAVLSAALQRMVQDGTLPTNVAKGVKMPRTRTTTRMRFLSPDEFAALAAAIRPDYLTFICTLYGTGMRFGEATALTPDDLTLDADQPRLEINKAWKRTRDGWEVGPPKTDRSVRSAIIPAGLVEPLRDLAKGKAPDDLLFTTSTGVRITHPNFWHAAWQPACDAAGLSPRPRVHDLRHSFASQLIAKGAPLPVIQRALGHESIKTTVDRYGHLAPGALAGVADMMDLALAQALPKTEPEQTRADEIEGEVLEERQIEGSSPRH